MLRAISTTDVNRIQSAQVITSLSGATKELVENSIDAGATKISIKFSNYGLDLLEVTDDGPGIEESEFEGLVTKHATSKISTFDDIEDLETLGFRGEALSSLCTLSSLTITTCTKSTYPMGFSLTFDHEGILQDKKNVSAQVGTMIRVTNLFSTLPVRRKDFEKNAKKDFVKTARLLQAYAAIQVRIRMEAVNITGNSRSQLLGANGTTGGNSLKRNLGDIFGAALSKTLVQFSSELSFKSVHQRKRDLTVVRFDGHLSSPQKQYGGQPDRQLTYINSRPCHLQRIIKTINEIFSSLGANRAPFILLNLVMPTDAYDVNVTPDKRTIFLHDEQIIIDYLREEINLLFTNERRDIPSSTTPIKGSDTSEIAPGSRLRARFLLDGSTQSRELEAQDLVIDTDSVADESAENESKLEPRPEQGSTMADSTKLSDSDSSDMVQINEKNENVAAEPLGTANDTPDLQMGDVADGAKVAANLHSISSSPQTLSTRSLDLQSTMLKRKRSAQITISARQTRLDFGQSPLRQRSASATSQKFSIGGDEPKTDQKDAVDDSDEEMLDIKQEITQDSGELEECPEPIVSPVKPLQRFIPRLRHLDQSNQADQVHAYTVVLNSKAALKHAPQTAYDARTERVPNDNLLRAGLHDESDIAEQALTLNISRNDFFGMTVIGQFNLGFIIVSRNAELFIIDQHASDEKSNYERLLRDTVMQSQQLALPKLLELSAVEKISMEEHLDTLRKNGFEIEVRRTDADETMQYFMTSVPVSKNITFDMSDLEEILDSLVDGVPGKSVRCTKAKRMFASRACRSSIMIGTALTREKMQAIVWHLGEMDAPWNCPHGRPTMRHLTSTAALTKWTLDYD